MQLHASLAILDALLAFHSQFVSPVILLPNAPTKVARSSVFAGLDFMKHQQRLNCVLLVIVVA